MDRYVTGAVIKQLRERRGLTQAALADLLAVSDKTVSKWETGKGYPDITLLEPLSRALGVSTVELFAGAAVRNRNRAGNMRHSALYVCPVCGNVVTATGEAVVCCCGVTLPPQQAEAPDPAHAPQTEIVEDEYYVTLSHPMEKDHYISFLAAMGEDGLTLVKLYPEGDAAARFPIRRTREILWYCNQHGLFRMKLK